MVPEEVIERAVFKKAKLALSVTLDANVVFELIDHKGDVAAATENRADHAR